MLQFNALQRYFFFVTNPFCRPMGEPTLILPYINNLAVSVSELDHHTHTTLRSSMDATNRKTRWSLRCRPQRLALPPPAGLGRAGTIHSAEEWRDSRPLHRLFLSHPGSLENVSIVTVWESIVSTGNADLALRDSSGRIMGKTIYPPNFWHV